jgi:uncharacterized OsmC-like protein
MSWQASRKRPEFAAGGRIAGSEVTTKQIAAAMKRAESVLKRRPGAGLTADAPAMANWEGGMRVVTRSEGGPSLSTDMPGELGGSGDRVSPGWLLRAGLASCLVTRIAMAAAAQGIDLESIDVAASSRSDARGLLGMTGGAGERIDPGPLELTLHVRISARGIPPERLRALVDYSHAHSPVSAAISKSIPISLSVESI